MIKIVLYSFFALCTLGMAKAPEEIKKLSVYLDWFPNVEFAGMFFADEHGLYAKRGIQVERVFKDLNIIERVCNNEADIGMVSAHDLFDIKKNPCGAKAFAAKYQLNPNSIVVPANSQIYSIKDLKGKKLGIFSSNETNMYKAMLAYNGIELSDVQLVEVKTFKESEIIKLFKRSKIDAIIAWEFNWTITFSLLKFPVRVFPGYENGFNFYGIVYFARPETILNKEDLLLNYLSATLEGWRKVFEKPSGVVEHIVDTYYPKQSYINASKLLTARQQRAELRLRKRYFLHGTDIHHMGTMSNLRWQQSFRTAKNYGFLTFTHNPQPKDFYTNKILKRLYAP